MQATLEAIADEQEKLTELIKSQFPNDFTPGEFIETVAIRLLLELKRRRDERGGA